MTIQEKIDALKKEFETKIAELEKQAKAKEQKQGKVWKPKEGEVYFSLTESGCADKVEWTDFVYDKSVYERGLCFKTKKEAEWADQHRIVETELKHFVQENDPHPITEEDWENESLSKYYIRYIYRIKNQIVISGASFVRASNQVYASSKEVLLKAIEHIGEERLKKYYFGVE